MPDVVLTVRMSGACVTVTHTPAGYSVTAVGDDAGDLEAVVRDAALDVLDALAEALGRPSRE